MATHRGQANKQTDKQRPPEASAYPTSGDTLVMRRLSDIIIGEPSRTVYADLDRLVQSIRVRGLLSPVLITPDNVLIAGECRIEAHRVLGLEWIQCLVKSAYSDITEICWAKATENSSRANLVVADRVRMANRLFPIAATYARARQAHRPPGQTSAEGLAPGEEELLENFPEAGNAMDIVAAEVSMSRKTLKWATAVYEAGTKWPERYGDLIPRMDKSVSGAYNEMLRRVKAESLSPDTPAPAPKQASMRLKNGKIQRKGNLTDEEWLVLLDDMAGEIRESLGQHDQATSSA